MKLLDNVTLLTIMGNPRSSFKENYNLMDKIINRSCTELRFNSIKILSAQDEDFNFKHKNVSITKINPMSQAGYNAFCINELYKYVDTEFVLLFQNDGFILNPEHWSDDFLNYDYIGAPWPSYEESRVGNGGFSLRSKKFLNTTKDLVYLDNVGLSGGSFTPEDHLLCRYYYNYLIKVGIKFAPIDIAIRFSFEQFIPEYPFWNNDMSLGFHGLFQAGWDNDEFRLNLKKQYNLL
jgi:hypothetical protein